MHIALVIEAGTGDVGSDAADLLSDWDRLRGKKARGYEIESLPLVPGSDLARWVRSHPLL